MSLKSLSDYTIYSRYAHYLPEKKRRETWDEITDRVFGMHERKYAKQLAKSAEFRADFEFAKDMVKRKKVLGSQRALQFGGKWIEKTNQKLFNCSYTYIDRPAVFQEIEHLLLSGCGVGFSVQKHHVKKLPDIVAISGSAESVVYQIPDSIEGWANAIGLIVNSYFKNNSVWPEYAGKRVSFDYSLIRPEGSLIAGQFKAPGHKGLEKAVEKIRALIERRLASPALKSDEFSDKLRPIDVYDIVMFASDSVLSGGIRRSATISLFSHDDAEMMSAKTGNWFMENPQRGRSNNSVLLVRGETSWEQFKSIMESTRQFGEPGFYFASSTEHGANPSLRAGTLVLTNRGIVPIDSLEDSGFKVQNLYDKTESAICKLSGVNQRLYKLTLDSEIEYFATKEHKWPIIENCGFQKRETAQLMPGDKIPYIRRSDLGYGHLGSKDDGFVVGWLYGDGWITDRKDNGVRQYGFIVSDADSKYGIHDLIHKKLSEHSARHFKFSERTYEKSNYPCYELNVQGKGINDYLRTFGVDKKELGLPSKIWTECSEEFRKGFIDGIFSSDGGVYLSESGGSAGKISISSSREKLLRDLQNLLGFYGIQSKIFYKKIDGKGHRFPNGKTYDKTFEVYTLSISRKNDVAHFRNVFSFSHLEKQRKLNQISSLSEIISNTDYLLVSSVEETDLYENVWDIRVNDYTHCFNLSHCVTGNCVEIGLYPQTADGRSGVQFCNLCEINGKPCDTPDAFYEACRAASIIGTMQAGYTDFPYLSKESAEITAREALLGVSITGIMDNPKVLLDPKIQQEGAKVCRETNARVAGFLGINPAARITCTKPAGSTSCVLQTASGIHPHHARRYLRRVQANRLEFPLQHYKTTNPLAVEKSVWSANGTDDVISFPCEVPKGAILKNDLNAVDMLSKVRSSQINWVIAGENPELSATHGIHHNISNTVVVRDDEWDNVAKYIYDNREYFTGISLLSSSGDLDYPQAPFATVLTPEEIVREYGDGSIIASGLIVDGLHAFDGNLWAACDQALGFGAPLSEGEEPVEPVKPPRKDYKNEKTYSAALASYAIELNLFYQAKGDYEQLRLKIDWVRRAKQFAERYFSGDLRRATYCLKHVSLWHTWLTIKRNHKDIDWSNVIEETESHVAADTLAAQACAGGACTI